MTEQGSWKSGLETARFAAAGPDADSAGIGMGIEMGIGIGSGSGGGNALGSGIAGERC